MKIITLAAWVIGIVWFIFAIVTIFHLIKMGRGYPESIGKTVKAAVGLAIITTLNWLVSLAQ